MFSSEIQSTSLELAEKSMSGGSAPIARHRLHQIIEDDRLKSTRKTPENQKTPMRDESPGADMQLLHTLLAERHIDAQENER